KRTTHYVFLIVASAAFVTLLLPSFDSGVAGNDTTAIVVLFALVLLAELLPFAMPKGVSGATSSMPLFAAAIVSPTWHTVAATALVEVFVETVRRRDWQKAVFNISQYSLTVAIAALVYLVLGGKSLLALGTNDISAITISV